MALHRVRLDSSSSEGLKQKKNDQDDEIACEKQRLDIIEVSSVAHSRHLRYVVSVVYLSKRIHVEYASPNTCCAHSLGGQTETIECSAHEPFGPGRRPNAEKTA